MASNVSIVPAILITAIGNDDSWNSSLESSFSTIYGDALQLTQRSEGGKDGILGRLNYTNYLYGDAVTLSNSKGGRDTLTGGNKTDYIYGDGYKLEADSDGNSDYLVGGDDDLSGGAGKDFLYGDGYSVKNAWGGKDTLNGGLGADFLYGDGYSLTSTVGGDDSLVEVADASSNYLYGDGYSLSISFGGADLLDASESLGNNYLYGDGYQLSNSVGGNDILWGGRGNDILYGDGLKLTTSDPGNDVIWGGKGNDTLYGDARSITYASGATFGSDIFQFIPGDGKDIIMDFQPGIDELDLRNWGVSTRSELASIATITTTSYQTKIAFLGTSDMLTLNGKFDLTDNDFYSGA